MSRIILVGLLLCFFTACKDHPTKVVKKAPIAFKKEGTLSIYHPGNDSLVSKLDIEIADNDYETETGLMYRDAMEQHQGMLFVFPRSSMHYFYMKNTKIPLDILYIDSGQKIVNIRANAVPFDETGLSSRVPVQYVLEINASLVNTWGIQLGDSIAYEKN